MQCFDSVDTFDTNLQSSQDWDMWLRIAREFKFAHVPRVLARSYWHRSNRISDEPAKICQGKKSIFREYFRDIVSDPVAFYQITTRLGYYCSAPNLEQVRQRVRSLFYV